jgi:ubiquinol-cytochrome c reductase cytochrome b subunit
MVTLFLMPIVGRWELGRRFNMVWTFALLVGAGVLTGLAWYDDHYRDTPEAVHYRAAVENAKVEADRAIELAGSPIGIPPTGALAMLQADPKVQGPKLFKQHCAACHSHSNENGTSDITQQIVAEKPSASNLWGFGGRDWVRGMLDPQQVGGPHYFGNTALKDDDMVKWVNDTIGKQLKESKGDDLNKLKSKLDDVTFALAVEANQPVGMLADRDKHVAAGRDAIVNEFACTDCHKFRDKGELGSAPDLTGYASRDWLTAFIANPADNRFYGEKNDRMPAFAAHPTDPSANRLSPLELTLLVSWLRGEWYESAAEINPPGAAPPRP